jgi:hypothetical protein
MSKTNLFEMEESARSIGGIIGDCLPKDVGFVLILATKGEGGWSTYLSNCQRADMIKAMREMIGKLEDPSRPL